MYDFCIAGAGFYGSTFARIATDHGMKCIVFESKSHVAGAAADKPYQDWHVPLYGAHIFHTDSEAVWNFVNRFGTWVPYRHTVRAVVGGIPFSFPINLATLQHIFGCSTPLQAEQIIKRERIPCKDPQNFEDWALSIVGPSLYKMFIRGYTWKQYGRDPHELPASIIRRLPVRLTYNDSYFVAKYQAMPTCGYTEIVKRMLTGVRVELNTPLPDNWRDFAKRLMYTGPVPGLEYLSMQFTEEEMVGDPFGISVTNFCDPDVPFLRTVDARHLRPDRTKHQVELYQGTTLITTDWPTAKGEPYYPIQTPANIAQHSAFVKAAPDRIHYGGRLGNYRYYDMDQAIAAALMEAERLCK